MSLRWMAKSVPAWGGTSALSAPGLTPGWEKAGSPAVFPAGALPPWNDRILTGRLSRFWDFDQESEISLHFFYGRKAELPQPFGCSRRTRPLPYPSLRPYLTDKSETDGAVALIPHPVRMSCSDMREFREPLPDGRPQSGCFPPGGHSVPTCISNAHPNAAILP